MADYLDRILETKRAEVAQLKARKTMNELRAAAEKADPPRGFVRALQTKISAGLPAVIAEVKKASPSKGLICLDFNPARTAQQYEAAGAACLSVLTDSVYFQGSEAAFRAARAAVGIPALRKDFMIDEAQIYESRAMGADAVLLIMRALTDGLALKLAQTALSLGMDVLTESHDEGELKRALALPVTLIGINNRNLRTFVTSIDTTLALHDQVPGDRIIVSESGIATPQDVAALKTARVGAYLVGESLMRQGNPGAALTQRNFFRVRPEKVFWHGLTRGLKPVP